MGAAPANYAAVSEAARLRSASQSGSHGPHGAELRSGAASMSDASSRRGSHGSTLAMHPAVAQLSEASPQFHADGGSPHRRPPAAGFPGYQSNLNTIPGSVAASEIASADHQSLYSGAQSHGGDATVPPRLPSIPASSPLILQDAAAVANAPRAASFGSTAARLTAEPATDTLRSNDASTGTYNSDGTYNTYTGAIKGQLRVVGSSDAHADGARGTTTIVEEESPVSGPRREMSGDSKAGEFWIEGREKSKLGAAGQRLGQHSSNNSTSSINKNGSRMIEMLDVDEQPHVPESVTGPAEPSPSTPSRPSFWKERTKSSQSIAKVFRSSPLLHANASPSERSPAPTSGARLSGVAAESSRSHSVPEHLPPLDLGRSVAISDHRASDSPKTEGDAEMWKDASKQKHGGAMRRWTRKKAGRSGSGTQGVDNEWTSTSSFADRSALLSSKIVAHPHQHIQLSKQPSNHLPVKCLWASRRWAIEFYQSLSPCARMPISVTAPRGREFNQTPLRKLAPGGLSDNHVKGGRQELQWYAEAVGSCITCIAWRCGPHRPASLAAVDTERPELTWRSAAHNHVSQDSLAASSCDLFSTFSFSCRFSVVSFLLGSRVF